MRIYERKYIMTLIKNDVINSYEDAHLYKVEVFFRSSEDSDHGIHTITDIKNHRVTMDYDMSRNPSSRRNATILYFNSETGDDFVNVFIQDKGTEFVYEMPLILFELSIFPLRINSSVRSPQT
jgi:hypothetical protein